MNSPRLSDDYLDELEGYIDELPRPDERTFYILLLELANMRAQMSMMTGILLDLYAEVKDRDFDTTLTTVTTGLDDRQHSFREVTVEELKELLKRLREKA